MARAKPASKLIQKIAGENGNGLNGNLKVGNKISGSVFCRFRPRYQKVVLPCF